MASEVKVQLIVQCFKKCQTLLSKDKISWKLNNYFSSQEQTSFTGGLQIWVVNIQLVDNSE